MPQTNVGDLEDKSANGIWHAYFSGKIGNNRTNSQAIEESQRLREDGKGDYELISQFGGIPVWKSSEDDHYTYDDSGNLTDWQVG